MERDRDRKEGKKGREEERGYEVKETNSTTRKECLTFQIINRLKC